MKRKVCVVVTARPSYSRIKTALQSIKAHEDLELQLVVVASALLERYGHAITVIEKDGFQVAARAYTLLEGENLSSMAKTTGISIMELSSIFTNLQPDMVVTIADRYETIATAIAASYMNIPLVHVQGGEVTGSIDEKVRHAITKLSDLHLVSNKFARERLIRMGEEESTIHVTGCPSIDLAREVMESTSQDDFDPFAIYGGVGATVDLSYGYLIVLQHPVTTEQSLARIQIEETLHAIKDISLPTLWFWPNPDAGSDGTSKGIRVFREKFRPEHIHFFKNMEPLHFLSLLRKSKCIVGNSSVSIRECSFLGVPAVNIGVRQSGRDCGSNVISVSHDRYAISQAIHNHLDNSSEIKQDYIYGDGFAGERIADLLARCQLKIEKRLTY